MAIYTLSEWNCIPSGVWNSHLGRTRCLGRPQRPGPVLFCDMISSYGRLFKSFVEHLWLVGGLKHGFYFSVYIYLYWECHHPNWRIYIYWECHHPNWRTPSFFRGVGIAPTRISFDPNKVLVTPIIANMCFHKLKTKNACVPLDFFRYDMSSDDT